MDDKYKQVLKRAVMIAVFRDGDVSTEDGVFATTDIDEMIYLEEDLQEAFDTELTPASRKGILAAIDEL